MAAGGFVSVRHRTPSVDSGASPWSAAPPDARREQAGRARDLRGLLLALVTAVALWFFIIAAVAGLLLKLAR
jgi:hypothetical protein